MLVWPPTLEVFFDYSFNLEAPLGNYVNTKYALVIHALVIELTKMKSMQREMGYDTPEVSLAFARVMTRHKCHSHTQACTPAGLVP